MKKTRLAFALSLVMLLGMSACNADKTSANSTSSVAPASEVISSVSSAAKASSETKNSSAPAASSSKPSSSAPASSAPASSAPASSAPVSSEPASSEAISSDPISSAPISSEAESSAEESSEVSSSAPVVKKEANIEITNTLDRTYDGEASVVTHTEDTDGEVTVSWYKEETLLDSAPSDAGTYKVVLSSAETDTYKAGTAEKEFTIEKYAMGVLGDAGYEKGKTTFTHTCDWLHDGIIDGDDVVVTLTTVSDAAGIYCGEEDITSFSLSGEDAGNYTLVADDIMFEIITAAVDVPVVTENTFTYDGTAKSLDIPESEYYTITGNEATEIGTYTVTVSLNDTNHRWADNKVAAKTYDLVIKRAYTSTFEMDIEDLVDTDQGVVVTGTVTKGKVAIGMYLNALDELDDILKTGQVTSVRDENTLAVDELTVGETGSVTLRGVSSDDIDYGMKVVCERKAELCDYTYNAPTVTKAPTATEEGVATYVAKEDPNITVEVPIHNFSSYYTKATKKAATCTSKGITTYSLNWNGASNAMNKAVQEKKLPEAYKDEDEDTYIQEFEDICVFDVEDIDIDSANHTDSSWKWAIQPTYDVNTNKSIDGSVVNYCEDCGETIETEREYYENGTWTKQDDGTYNHVYQYEDEYLNGETGRSSWKYYLDLNGGVSSSLISTSGSKSVTTANSVWTITVTDKNGVANFTKTGYHISGIRYYVDGVTKRTLDTTASDSTNTEFYAEAYTNGNYLRYSARIGNQTSVELFANFTGDVYAKLLWEADTD